MYSAKELGNKGEAVACLFYQKNGYHLLEHGYKCRFGELDLVMLKGNTIVIAEVKTRGQVGSILPREAVDYRKQKRIIAASKHYLSHIPEKDWTIRFDVVEVIPVNNGWKVHCIENAFEQ